MSSDAEKLQSLLVCGTRKRPQGTRKRIGLYIDMKLIDEAEQAHIFTRRSRVINPVSFSSWIETTMARCIQDKKISQ